MASFSESKYAVFMYNWRKMSEEQRACLLAYRRLQDQPWHSPPHAREDNWYHISAACFEHQPIIGKSPDRMAEFSVKLLENIRPCCAEIMAWCVLPNHYHVLAQCFVVQECRSRLGKLHGSTSHTWNQQDESRGRQVWCKCLPREIKSLDHRFATLNYVLHNPVHHGYATQWRDWPFGNAEAYLEAVGRERAEYVWRKYPVLDMGRNWDDAEL